MGGQVYTEEVPKWTTTLVLTLWLTFTFPSQLYLWQQYILCVQDSNMQ